MQRNCITCKEETSNEITLRISDRSIRRNGVHQIVYNSVLCKKCLRQILRTKNNIDLIKKEMPESTDITKTN